MGHSLREFYARLDGETDIATLLGDSEDEVRSRRMDRIVLQIRKGAVALLPAPLSKLETEADRTGSEPSARWWRRVLAPRSPGR